MGTVKRLRPERRDYSRLKVGLKGLAFKDGEELDFTIADICEIGICMEVLADKAGGIKIHDLLRIEFIDELRIGRKSEEYVLICRAKVKHIEKKDGNKLIIGCYIYSYEFNEYVTRKKFEDYLNNKDKWHEGKNG